jgi:large subunit ribosomal protein L22
MEVLAKARYVRRTPRKARLVADLVRGLKVEDALTRLQFTPRHAAVDVAKAIKSAAANAEHNHSLARDELFVKTIMVDEGPRIKRFRPASRGMAHPYAHRTCHITVVVEDRPELGRPTRRRPQARPAPAPEPEPELVDEIQDEVKAPEQAPEPKVEAAAATETEAVAETAPAEAAGTVETKDEAAETKAEAEEPSSETPEKKTKPKSARKEEGVE